MGTGNVGASLRPHGWMKYCMDLFLDWWTLALKHRVPGSPWELVWEMVSGPLESLESVEWGHDLASFWLDRWREHSAESIRVQIDTPSTSAWLSVFFLAGPTVPRTMSLPGFMPPAPALIYHGEEKDRSGGWTQVFLLGVARTLWWKVLQEGGLLGLPFPKEGPSFFWEVFPKEGLHGKCNERLE